MNNLKLSKSLIESELSDLEVYLYAVIKYLKNKDSKRLVSINQFIEHTALLANYKPTSKQYKLRWQPAIKAALARLIELNIISCKESIFEQHPDCMFELFFNSANNFESSSEIYFEIDTSLFIFFLLNMKLSLKTKYLRKYFSEEIKLQEEVK